MFLYNSTPTPNLPFFKSFKQLTFLTKRCHNADFIIVFPRISEPFILSPHYRSRGLRSVFWRGAILAASASRYDLDSLIRFLRVKLLNVHKLGHFGHTFIFSVESPASCWYFWFLLAFLPGGSLESHILFFGAVKFEEAARGDCLLHRHIAPSILVEPAPRLHAAHLHIVVIVTYLVGLLLRHDYAQSI